MFLKIRVTNFAVLKEFFTFATLLKAMLSLWGMNMVDIVQLVRASDCGSECRGFESHYPPSTRRNGADFICLPRFLFLIRKRGFIQGSIVKYGFYAFYVIHFMFLL